MPEAWVFRGQRTKNRGQRGPGKQFAARKTDGGCRAHIESGPGLPAREDRTIGADRIQGSLG